MPDERTHEILLKVSESFGPANDPRSPENKDDQDFQAGYAIGRKNEDIPLMRADHPLWIEASRRGLTATESDESFDRWKQGYWSGRYMGRMQEILDTPDPEFDAAKAAGLVAEDEEGQES